MKIMFVCHGNICRSPMAEFILKDMLRKKGLDANYTVASAATSTEEIGNPVYPPARAELSRHGISCSGKHAVQLRYSDYDKWDLFLVMDGNNLRNIRRIFPDDPAHRIHKLLDYAGIGGDVADPWYTGAFDVTYRAISEALERLVATGFHEIGIR